MKSTWCPGPAGCGNIGAIEADTTVRGAVAQSWAMGVNMYKVVSAMVWPAPHLSLMLTSCGQLLERMADQPVVLASESWMYL
jgi:hypothetical protein